MTIPTWSAGSPNHSAPGSPSYRLRIRVNDVLCTDVKDDMVAEGYIGLQHHKNGKKMKTLCLPLMASCFTLLGFPASSTRAAGPLPEFTFKAVALHPQDLAYAPTEQLIHPTIIKTEGRVENPLGKYYLYYVPHKHVAISMAYSASIEGPWTEYQSNPVIKGPSAPDIRCIEEHGKFYMWGHRKNSQTELWTSEDGIHFEYHSVSVTAKNIGTRNATYSRVYEYPLERFGSKYVMLYSGFIEDRGIRCVWMAHSSASSDPRIIVYTTANAVPSQSSKATVVDQP